LRLLHQIREIFFVGPRLLRANIANKRGSNPLSPQRETRPERKPWAGFVLPKNSKGP